MGFLTGITCIIITASRYFYLVFSQKMAIFLKSNEMIFRPFSEEMFVEIITLIPD
jgi:hypothetical protein